MSDVREDPVAPGQPEVPGTRQNGIAPVDAPVHGNPDVTPAAARRIARLAGKKGGSRPKSTVPVTGLGASTPAVIPPLDQLEGRLQILASVVEALALGRCSSATATAIIQAVKAAGEDARQDQGEQLEALTVRVQELVDARTIAVRR